MNNVIFFIGLFDYLQLYTKKYLHICAIHFFFRVGMV